MKKTTNECPKKRRESCKDCKCCNRCRLRKFHNFLKVNWISICLIYLLALTIFQLILVIAVSNMNKQQEIQDKERQERIENYKTPELATRQSIKKTLSKFEPIIIIESQPAMPTSSTVKTTLIKAQPEPKEELVSKISPYGPGDNYYYLISNDDYINLKKVVYKEARGESFEGQVAVAAVVLNRYSSGDHSKFNCSSVTSVILQTGQFASISDVSEAQLKEYPSVTEAVQQALKGYDPTRLGFADGATFFYQPETTNGIELDKRQGVKTYRIGNHLFHNDFAF